jgi:tetratricopeptide (TPR) repeat protein
LQGHVDEIVLVDTGSSDETLAIAERFGCRIFHHLWDDDFSAPRNLGLSHVASDWILYIDADERLSCASDAPLKSLLEGNAAAARVKFYPRPIMTAYAEYRVFRNDPRIRFSGAIHETVVPAVERVCQEDGIGIGDWFDVALIHHGYEGDQTLKHARNLPILRRAIADDPERVYLRYHLGAILEAIGLPGEAEVELNQGIELAESPSRLAQAKVEGSSCAQLLSNIYLTAGDVERAFDCISRGLALYPGNCALHWAHARCLVAAGRARQAIDVLSGPLDRDAERFFDPAIAYDKQLFGEYRHGLMGSAWLRLNAFAEAAECFDRAAALADDPIEYRAKATLARTRLAKAGADLAGPS